MMRHGVYPAVRLRRLRQNQKVRDLVKQTRLAINQFILPLFIRHGKGIKKPIAAMPGHFQLSLDKLGDEIKAIDDSGIKGVILFGIPEKKDPYGSDAYSDNGIIQSAIALIKKIAPRLLVISDICFCEYTDHGHCGVIIEKEKQCIVHNDKTLDLLGKQAVSHALAGADIVAPSGMMDGMVQAIRHALDANGFEDMPLLSYAVKYASAMYGPFREAAEGAPQFGDRRSYQMDYANLREAVRECALDVSEGADMLMVKPAHTYLDIIKQVKDTFPHLPLGAYHTSGEYAMLKAAAQNKWIDERSGVLEVLTAIRRAGADFIISYYTREIAVWLAQD